MKLTALFSWLSAFRQELRWIEAEGFYPLPLALILVFHSMLEVGCSMLDVNPFESLSSFPFSISSILFIFAFPLCPLSSPFVPMCLCPFDPFSCPLPLALILVFHSMLDVRCWTLIPLSLYPLSPFLFPLSCLSLLFPSVLCPLPLCLCAFAPLTLSPVLCPLSLSFSNILMTQNKRCYYENQTGISQTVTQYPGHVRTGLG